MNLNRLIKPKLSALGCTVFITCVVLHLADFRFFVKTTATNSPGGMIRKKSYQRNELPCLPLWEQVQKKHGNYTVPLYKIVLGKDQYERDYNATASYSRFMREYPLESRSSLHFTISSDRKNHHGVIPLRGLVNSLMMHSSAPVVLHIVTSGQVMDWLDALDSPYFQINFYNHQRLNLASKVYSFNEKLGFKTIHGSMPYTMMKPLFSANLPFPDTVHNYVQTDDDIVFWSDPVELFQQVNQGDKLGISCPLNQALADYYYMQQNLSTFHPTRYCNSGLIYMPVTKRRPHPDFGKTDYWLDMYVAAMVNMTTEYPNALFPTSDQDVYNRLFTFNEEKVTNIPCQWHCNTNNCQPKKKKGLLSYLSHNRMGHDDGSSQPFEIQCDNCLEVGTRRQNWKPVKCNMMHFLAQAYDPIGHQDPNSYGPPVFAKIYEKNSLQLLYDVFTPRIVNTNSILCRG